MGLLEMLGLKKQNSTVKKEINQQQIDQLTYLNKEFDTDEELFEDVIEYIAKVKKASASLLQRRYRIGYNKAASIIDELELYSYIGPHDGSKPREVLITEEDVPKIIEEVRKRRQENNKKNELENTETFDDLTTIDMDEEMKRFDIKPNYSKINEKINIPNLLITNNADIDDKVTLLKYLLTNYSPLNMKLVLYNENKVTFDNFNGVPHLLAPVVIDIGHFSSTLSSITKEMNRRYDKFLENKVKTYDEYFEKDNTLPYIVIIIDEVSELLQNKDTYNRLVNLLLKGNRVGISIIAFSSYNKRNLELGKAEDLLEIYNKFNVKSIFNNTTKPLLESIDNDMDGFDFEKYSAEILYANGFDKIEVTKSSGDYGVDLIAHKDGMKFSIQCKKYSNNVGIEAVQEVIGSMSMYDCHVGIVLTNSYFTKQATNLAEKNKILLWDRNKLKELLEVYENNKNK